MDDRKLEILNQALKNMEHQLMSSCATDCFFYDILDDTHASIHTNKPEQGVPQNPELAHSPNYVHFGTRTLPVEEKSTTEDTDESSVRRYRERKKARQAAVEDELIKMRIVNQKLLKRLQGIIALEQQVARFKCLLVEIRGRIKGQLGSFPYQNPTNGMGVIPQNMPQPSSPVGAYVHGAPVRPPIYTGSGNNSGCKEFLEVVQANVRLNTNLNTSTAAKTRKGRA
ncbi:hypothetical protein MKW94_011182 [Papaver nudicaule]|uniref:BZIP domain-containing protein n=1 Tax=Papaver nudicaule TaxID=74823 RepID=A0AA41S6T9_PAPNU|nr:hypothetical protein [Papaver nudicaule]